MLRIDQTRLVVDQEFTNYRPAHIHASKELTNAKGKLKTTIRHTVATGEVSMHYRHIENCISLTIFHER